MDIVYFIMQQTMFFAIPLLIVAIGGMYSERSGVINIALEGIMVIGAFAGVLFINMTQANLSGQGLLLIAIVIAGVTGGIFSLLHAFASINMKAEPDNQRYCTEHVCSCICNFCSKNHSGSAANSVYRYFPD